MELTRTFPAEAYAQALESWSWLPIASKKPVLATAFGDVFLQDSEGYWFLDTVEGKLNHIATTTDELKAALRTPEGQDKYLMAGLALAAERSGLSVGPDQVLDFNRPPVLGGAMEVANLSAKNFVVAINIAGQIHDQVRKLPPGTKVSNINIK